MFEKIKELFCQEKIIEKTTLEKHDVILEELDKTKLIAHSTFEQSVRLRGFPIGRTVRKGTHTGDT